jgi:hypothetical protein
MTIRRSTFFLILFIIVITPFLVSKAWWLLHSKKTTGTMRFRSKNQTGMYVHEYSCIRFLAGNDTVWFNTTDNVFFKPGEVVTVLYQRDNPSDARVNVFADMWGDTVVYAGIPALILLVIFIHPHILPYRKKIKLVPRRPFVQTI